MGISGEVMKITGRGTPIHQWFHYSQFALVAGGVPREVAVNKANQLTQYDHLLNIVGRKISVFLRTVHLIKSPRSLIVGIMILWYVIESYRSHALACRGRWCKWCRTGQEPYITWCGQWWRGWKW
jgi:hypothetical protein